MSSHLLYVSEKLGSAVEIMATSMLPIRDRLERAREEFNPARGFEGGVPPEVASRLTQLAVRLETVRHASDAECSRLAHDLFNLTIDVHHLVSMQP